MSLQALMRNGFPSVADSETLALLMLLRDNPEVQTDAALSKMFTDAIAFLLEPSSMKLKSEPPALTYPIEAADSLMVIDSSGADAEDETPRPDAPIGAEGIDGLDGSNGGDAGAINLHLAVKEATIIARWDNGNASLKLQDAAGSIFLRAVGGRGGKGGAGGRGGMGVTGASGNNATSMSCGTNGKKGGCGRRGGTGGPGGNGGRGGAIAVYVDPENSDLLMLLRPPEISGGAKGTGGVGGKGGIGGNGGPGGASYAGQQMVASTQLSMNGRGGFEPRTYMTLVPCFKSGGVQGPEGDEGDNGSIGLDGKAGEDGSFQMVVGGIVYRSIYDLAMTVAKVVDLTRGNPDGFYEPGERVHLTASLHNVGGMPTPLQDIEVSMQPMSWAEQANSSVLLKASDSLPAGGTHTFEEPFSLAIADHPTLIDEDLDAQGTLTYQALLQRVNKSFSRVSQQRDIFSIRYPVRISAWNEKASAGFNEVCILSLRVQNITSIAMGKTGPQNRRIFVVFSLDTQDAELVKTDTEIDLLSPESEKQLSVSFRFTNPDLQQGARVKVIASLYLDYFRSDNEALPQARCIQSRSLQILYSGRT